MAKLTPLSLAQAQDYGRQFGVEITAIDCLDAGSVNSNFRLKCSGGRQLFGRIYEEQDTQGAVAELRLLQELSALGIPTSLPLRRTDGEPLISHAGKAFSLYEWVDGHHLCNQLVTPKVAGVLGQTLARVHAATPQLSGVPTGRFGFEKLKQRLEFIQHNSEMYAEEARAIEQQLSQYIERSSVVLPSGLIHGDLFRDNVLWKTETLASSDAPEIAALLDFESASQGVFAYDLMVCLLSWCYTDGLVVAKAKAMLEGYQSVRPLQRQELEQMPIQGALVCLRFATTRITDFSMRVAPGEPPGRDYKRFLKRLSDLENGVLAKVLA